MPLSSYPKHLPPIKLAVISDLHGGGVVHLEQIAKVVERTNELRPDVILFVGDAVDGPRSLLEDLMKPLKFLQSKYGTYFVTGNHEYFYGDAMEWIDLFNNSYGMNVLDNKVVHINNVCIVGLNDISSNRSGITNHSFRLETLLECNSNTPIILMHHNPIIADRIVLKKFLKHVKFI
uniref:Calcineurin-like phosphoesterase domain-containing protein n=1 Tax=Acrobeloides nanus TaxID=290746 RepID=A0A914DJ18_9BILA